MSESGLPLVPDDALVDLLVKQVTEGLSPAEQRTLDAMDGALVSEYLRDFERAAAAVTLVGLTPVELPPGLRVSLESSIDAARPTVVKPGVVTPGVVTPIAVSRTVTVPAKARVARASSMGWFAAAACLVLAIFGWMRSPPPVEPPPVADVHVSIPAVAEPPVQAPAASPTPSEERTAMLARPDSQKIPLGATKDPAAVGVTGDVVWDPVTQTGFVHFVGLASNDPQVRQYQIWIFDAKRDKRYPVDAGVFDVPADASEVVIPIRASLSITTAKAFAVTVEKPGGVVVSALGHVVALGASSG